MIEVQYTEKEGPKSGFKKQKQTRTNIWSALRAAFKVLLNLLAGDFVRIVLKEFDVLVVKVEPGADWPTPDIIAGYQKAEKKPESKKV